jgi:histidinol phosphatase-like PHP family hydrolase
MFEAAIACPLTDAVAHPFVLTPNVFRLSEEEVSVFGSEMMRHVDQKRLIHQLDLASQREIAIEISPKFIRYNQRHLIEFYQLCLEREVKLLIGSDAHKAEELGELSELEPILEELGVQEEHLWRPKEWRW